MEGGGKHPPPQCYNETKKPSAYRVKGEGKIPPKEIPTKDETTDFGEALWGNPVQHKEETPWMKTLVEKYCQECEQKEYEISDEVLEEVLKRLANDKPGRDLVAGLWLKKLRGIKVHYKQQLKQLLRNESEPPNWLLTSEHYYYQRMR